MLNQQEQCVGIKIGTDQMSSRMASLIIPIQPANLSKIKSCQTPIINGLNYQDSPIAKRLFFNNNGIFPYKSIVEETELLDEHKSNNYIILFIIISAFYELLLDDFVFKNYTANSLSLSKDKSKSTMLS